MKKFLPRIGLWREKNLPRFKMPRKAAGASVQRALFALFAVALSRRYGQSEIVSGIALHRRDLANRYTIGMLAGVIPVRCQFDPLLDSGGMPSKPIASTWIAICAIRGFPLMSCPVPSASPDTGRAACSKQHVLHAFQPRLERFGRARRLAGHHWPV